MLLTAIAATVVIVSWVGDATRDRGAPDPPRPHDTQLAEQPLIGLGGGVTVREVTQDTPFSLVALTGDLAGTSTRVRAKRPDGSWGPWYQTEYETAAPDTRPPGGEGWPGRPAGWADRGAAQHGSRVRRHHHDGPDRGHPPVRCAGDPGTPQRSGTPAGTVPAPPSVGATAWDTGRRPRNSLTGRTSPRSSSPRRKRRPRRTGRRHPGS